MKAMNFFTNAATAAMLVLGLSTAALAQSAKKAASAKPAATTKKEVTGKINWTGYGVGKSHTGELTVKNGTVEMKGRDIVGGTVVIDMKSLKTGDSPKLEAHLKSPDFFDVEKFPEATFKITKAESAPQQAAQKETHIVWGELTIKGKTNPAEMQVTVSEDKGKFKATAATEIKDRTKYDIVYNSKQFKAVSALGDKLIEDNIKISLDLVTK